MAGQCGSCGGRNKPGGYVVKRPGKPERTVQSETAASSLVQGIPGASYTPKEKP